MRIRSILDPSAPSADDDLLRFKMMKMWGHLSSATLGRPSPEERERKRRLREAQMQQIQLELTLDRKHLKQSKAKQTSKSIFDLHRSKTFRGPGPDTQVRLFSNLIKLIRKEVFCRKKFFYYVLFQSTLTEPLEKLSKRRLKTVKSR